MTLGLHLIIAVLLMVQQWTPLEPLIIEKQGETMVEVDHSTYTIPVPGVPLVDDMKLNALMNDLDKRVFLPPKNAVINGEGRILAEQAGTTLNRERFKTQFYSYIYEGNLSRLEVPLRSVYAKVDSELLQSK